MGAWEPKKLTDLAEYINGYAFGPDDWGSDGLPIIRIEQLKNPAAPTDFFTGKLPQKNLINDGDLIFSWSASLFLRIWENGKAALNQHLFKVVERDGVDRAFLKSFIEFHLPSLTKASHGSTMQHITRKELEKFAANFPADEDEQKAIATVISAIDSAIEQTEALIAKQQRIKAGLMQDLLTKGIDKHGNIRSEATHEFKDSPLGRIPVEWGVQPLENLASVERGKFTHRPRNDPSFYGGEFPFIQTGDVTSRVGRTVMTFTQTLNEKGTQVSKEFPAGTIAITIAANIADTAILGIPMYFPDSVVGAVVYEPHNTRFVELMIRKWKPILEGLAPQSAQKNINLETLRPLAIPTPQPVEQERIGSLYEIIDCDQVRIEESARKLSLLKSGLMQDLLTGKVRVTPLLATQAAHG